MTSLLQSGYTYHNKLRKITVDSSKRIEDIISDLKLEKKGTLLYSNGRELPLNSSLATHNVQNGDTLESCSSPRLSAAISAALQDLEDVKGIPDDQRTKERIQPLLGGIELDPWPEHWSSDSITTRIICLATTKMVLQRSDKFANTQVPECKTLTELYTFMQTIWHTNNGRDGGGRRGGHNSMAHIIEPSSKNRDGKPSICWELLQHKLDKLDRMVVAGNSSGVDRIEAFVKSENHRNGRIIDTPSRRGSTPAGTPQSHRGRPSSSSSKKAPPVATAPGRKRSRITPSPTTSDQQNGIMCTTCDETAQCLCMEATCPFFKATSCNGE